METTTDQLDEIILGDLNKRISRYKMFKLNLSSEGLEKARDFDIHYIRQLPENNDFYLNHYLNVIENE